MIQKTQEEIMRDWAADNSAAPLVSICCTAYNHEPFIAAALDGFLMQKTNFSFEVIIHDDCSADGTVKIIKEYQQKYPEIIKPIFQSENQYSKGVRAILQAFVYPKCSGKYIALCEGDDYWIDKNKIQMQVNFLEENHGYAMCYTKTKLFVQEKNKILWQTYGSAISSFEDLLQNGNKIPALTVCYRKDIALQYVQEINPFQKKWLMGDYPMWLYIASKAKIKFINKETSVYRILKESASHSENMQRNFAFSKSTYEIREFYSQKESVPIEKWNEVRQMFLINWNFLLINVDKNEYRKNIQMLYKQLDKVSIKDFIRFVVSKNKILLCCVALFVRRS